MQKKFLFVINKAVNELDFVLPLIWSLKQDNNIEVNVLYTVVSKKNILRNANYYSEILSESNVKEYDYNDFTQGIIGKFLSLVNRLYEKNFADIQHLMSYKSYDNFFVRLIKHLSSARLIIKLLFQYLRIKQTDLISFTNIFETLKPTSVFFAYRGYKFYRRDDFIEALYTLGADVFLYPHGPFISNGFEKLPLFSSREKNILKPLPEFCNYWYSLKQEFTDTKYPSINKNISWVGYPGLDSRWLCYISKRTTNNSKKNTTKKRILFIIRKYAKVSSNQCQDYGVLQYDEFITIFNEVLRIVSSDYKYELIIKPHPHNDYNGLKKMINGHSNVKITNEPNYYEIPKCDAVIGFPSTSLLVPLLYGLPVILLNCSVLNQFKNEWQFMYDLFGGYENYVESLDKFEDVFLNAIFAEKVDPCQQGNYNREIDFFRNIYPDNSLELCKNEIGI